MFFFFGGGGHNILREDTFATQLTLTNSVGYDKSSFHERYNLVFIVPLRDCTTTRLCMRYIPVRLLAMLQLSLHIFTCDAFSHVSDVHKCRARIH